MRSILNNGPHATVSSQNAMGGTALALALSLAVFSLALSACSDKALNESSRSAAPAEPPSETRSEPGSERGTEPTVLAPGVISTDGFELGVSFAPDGRTAYFSRIGEGFSTSVILTSQWQDGQWSPPEPVSFAGQYRDIDAFVSPDGNKMFFQSDRPVEGSEPKDWDIWVSEKTDAGWGEPRNLGAPVNTSGVETYPVVVGDGSLYFSSDRDGGHGEGDVYRSRFVDGEYLEPENLGPPINTAEFDSNAFVAVDESYLILSSSSLPGHLGSGDLYLSRRLDSGWSELEHLPQVNSAAREFAPSVSPDGTTLFFTRDQRDPAVGEEFLGDIFQIELNALGIAP
ncbi:MAG: hypothetical protein AAF657_17990 [Acidobacteriota bacterium]